MLSREMLVMNEPSVKFMINAIVKVFLLILAGTVIEKIFNYLHTSDYDTYSLYFDMTMATVSLCCMILIFFPLSFSRLKERSELSGELTHYIENINHYQRQNNCNIVLALACVPAVTIMVKYFNILPPFFSLAVFFYFSVAMVNLVLIHALSIKQSRRKYGLLSFDSKVAIKSLLKN
jgi:hypothetical protein